MNLNDLHRLNPYANFPRDLYPPHPFAQWGSEDSNFAELIAKVQPKLIIEVGSWLGGSAIHMADLMSYFSWPYNIVCVDTWLGALEMWTDQTDETRYGALGLEFGYPTLYYTFLSNVIAAGHEDVIIPFPQTSLIAARWFTQKNIQADMIYLDGSHDYSDVVSDLMAYWSLVRPGGVLFGDDYYTWHDVGQAVRLFAVSLDLKVEVKERQWELWKPL